MNFTAGIKGFITLVIDPVSGKIADANEAALKFYGYNYEEITSLIISDINTLSPEEISVELKKVLTSDKNLFYFQHKIKSGEIKHVEVNITPLQIEGKEYLYSIVHDITEAVKTESLNKMLKHSLDIYTDGIYWMNSDNRFVYVNEAGGRMFGCKPEELLGRHLSEVNPSITPESLANLWQKLRTDGYYTTETIHRRIDGSEFFVEIRSVYVKHDGKEYNNGYARDISERKIIIQELTYAKEIAEESARKLRLSEEKLRVKLDFILSPQIEIPDFHLTDLIDLKQLQNIQDAFTLATGVASLITDVDGNPITETGNFSGVCRLIRETEKGREKCIMSDKNIGSKAAATRKPVIEKCQSCGFIDSGAPIFIGDKFIAIWLIGQVDVGGVTRELIENYSDEIGADKTKMVKEFKKIKTISIGQFKNIVNLLWLFAQELSSVAYNNLLLAKKIEEQKEYEKNLIAAKNKAEESDRLKSAFLHNMSHEIRTPMNAIMGFSELLAENYDDKGKLVKYTDIINQCSKDLLLIIDDILNIAKIESGLLKLSYESVNLTELFEELNIFYSEEKFRQNKPNVALRINMERDKEPVLIKTDQVRLKQIFLNLIGNALKFTDNGFVEAGFKDKNDGRFLFYVSDTGIGIPQNMHKAIFERFVQVDHENSKFYGGNGLGLSIVKGFVNLLGGDIWVESEEGRGSTFYFTINVV